MSQDATAHILAQTAVSAYVSTVVKFQLEHRHQALRQSLITLVGMTLDVPLVVPHCVVRL